VNGLTSEFLHVSFASMRLSTFLSWSSLVILTLFVLSAPAEVWSSNAVSAVSSAISADGRVLVATDTSTFVSCDYGVTWRSNNFSGRAAAVSANGSNIIIAGTVPAQIMVSTDSGTNWTSYAAPSTTSARQIACSSDATRVAMVLFASYPIFISANGGLTWSTNNDAPVTSWMSIASSTDGQRLLASSASMGLWLSTNFGVSWSSILASNNLVGVACSTDAKTVVVASGTDVVYVSSDFGATWSWQHVSNFGGSGAASSADGSSLAVISYMGVFISTNSGLTWATQTGAGAVLNTIATSADGHRWIAAHSGGQGRLYLGSSTPSPVIQIESANGKASLSWIAPSTPVTLQQAEGTAFNQGSWSPVTGAPTLNLNTLRHEMTVPLTNTTAFFRLSKS